MSSRVYVDTRAYYIRPRPQPRYIDTKQQQMNASSNIIQQAMEQLKGTRSTMSCGHAEVRTSNIDALSESRALQNVRFQDKMEAVNTSALQGELGRTAPDFTADALGDWSPALQNGLPMDDNFVDIDEAGNQSGMKLVEDLECAALDGARMMIFEVDDGSGNTSYKIGLEDSLFDTQGNWLNPEAKKAYDQFLSSALAAQRAAGDDDTDQRAPPQRLAAAMRGAGLEDTGAESLPNGARHTRFSTTTAESSVKPKARSSGGRDE